MQEHRNRWGVFLSMALAISSLISAIFYVPAVMNNIPFLPEALIRLDFLIQDRFVARLDRPDPLPNIAFLGIDQTTLKLNQEAPELVAASPTLTAMAQPFPWSRAVWGSVIEKLAESVPKSLLLISSFRSMGMVMRSLLLQ